MSLSKSILLNTDTYKEAHHEFYPEGLQKVISYIESRMFHESNFKNHTDLNENFCGDVIEKEFPKTLFFGLQMFLKEYLTKSVTMMDIDLAETLIKKHLPSVTFNRKGWEYVVKEHNGKLPVKIYAVKEGKLIPRSNILVKIVNTDKNCAWLTSFVETALLRSVWYPTTIATRSFYVKHMMKEFLEKTCDSDSTIHLNFMFHDFGARGVSSFESAGIGGVSHLVNFMGTDTITAMIFANEYYNSDVSAFSVQATEHSVMTITGEEKEFETIERIIKNTLKENVILSMVGDSYDIYKFCKKHIPKLKDLIKNSGGKLIIRPDSGIPHEIVFEVIEILGKMFGYTTNAKGFKELPSYIGIIQGDGVDYQEIFKVLSRLEYHGWAANNIVFGSGGWLLQKVDRDTFNFSMKACYSVIDGLGQDIFKKPTHGGKNSKSGDMTLIYGNKGYKTVPTHSINNSLSELELVFENGEIIHEDNFTKIKERANKELNYSNPF